jgi:hypothetical protein
MSDKRVPAAVRAYYEECLSYAEKYNFPGRKARKESIGPFDIQCDWWFYYKQANLRAILELISLFQAKSPDLDKRAKEIAKRVFWDPLWGGHAVTAPRWANKYTDYVSEMITWALHGCGLGVYDINKPLLLIPDVHSFMYAYIWNSLVRNEPPGLCEHCGDVILHDRNGRKFCLPPRTCQSKARQRRYRKNLKEAAKRKK